MNSDLPAILEACLLVSAKPISAKELAKVLSVQDSEIELALDALMAVRNVEGSGIHILNTDNKYLLATNPDLAEVVNGLAKEEITPELTQPSLETLTIIAYRGPITKPAIEAIRGVNCSLILRNLLIRGLIDESTATTELQPSYTLSTNALRFLGLHAVSELPEYNELHSNAQIDKLLSSLLN
jgi:segregation and condensation protein B